MPSLLIVDDEPDVRTVVGMSLDDDEFEISECARGEDALDRLATAPPDVMLLDLMLPGIDGFEVLARMRERALAPATRVVIMTARSSERDHLRGWELGADEYLTKPVDPDQLSTRVHAVLETSADALRSRRADELEKAALLERLEQAMTHRRPPVRR